MILSFQLVTRVLPYHEKYLVSILLTFLLFVPEYHKKVKKVNEHLIVSTNKTVFVPGWKRPEMNGTCEQKHFYPGLKVRLEMKLAPLVCEDTLNFFFNRDTLEIFREF